MCKDMLVLVGSRGHVKVCQTRDHLDGTPTPWAGLGGGAKLKVEAFLGW